MVTNKLAYTTDEKLVMEIKRNRTVIIDCWVWVCSVLGSINPLLMPNHDAGISNEGVVFPSLS